MRTLLPALLICLLASTAVAAADENPLSAHNKLGEKNPAPKVEQTKTSKADLIAGLKDAFAYCDKAYDGMTDASATQMVKVFGGDTPKLGVLMINNMHSAEHYGNLIAYMRLKNIVHPASDQAFMQQLRKL
jgi:hypothetical protein